MRQMREELAMGRAERSKEVEALTAAVLTADAATGRNLEAQLSEMEGRDEVGSVCHTLDSEQSATFRELVSPVASVEGWLTLIGAARRLEWTWLGMSIMWRLNDTEAVQVRLRKFGQQTGMQKERAERSTAEDQQKKAGIDWPRV